MFFDFAFHTNCPGAGNRRNWPLSALRARTKVPYKTDILWRTRRALDRPGRARTVDHVDRERQDGEGEERDDVAVVPDRDELALEADGVRLQVGFGRIVVPEKDVPNILVNLV